MTNDDNRHFCRPGANPAGCFIHTFAGRIARKTKMGACSKSGSKLYRHRLVRALSIGLPHGRGLVEVALDSAGWWLFANG